MQAQEYPGGVWFPDVRPLHALRATLPYWFPRVNEIIRLLGSHNVFAAPTQAQMQDPALKPLIDRYLRGAGDISFVAADLPGLVGLGPASTGDHTPAETVDLPSLWLQAKRAALLMSRLAAEKR
jgi:hypothetical protein